ncbi:thioredoxin family protein [Mycoplasma simbae]|uniref:thioredoxin family protein n=1 Tax=Mycoplasma simbae TaxID=36744 RepID=UPI0004978245|nr:thioredoxin family protein [Mycoplasma simbae]
MKKYSWENAQKLLADKTQENTIFLLVFTKKNDLESLIMRQCYQDVDIHFKFDSNIQVIEVDIDESQIFQDINNKYVIMQVPAFFVIKNNEIKRKGLGFYPREIMIDFIEENIE